MRVAALRCGSRAESSDIMRTPWQIPRRLWRGHFGADARGGDLRAAARGGGALLRCGHRCFIPEGRPGICRVRFNDGAGSRSRGICRGAACGSGREEAVLPRPSRIPRAVLRNAGVRLPLRVLSELDHVAGDPRQGRSLAARSGDPGGPGFAGQAAGRRSSPRPTTSRSSPRSGRSPSSGKRRRPVSSAPTSATATARSRSSITSVRT